jgi:hypothetical protein
LQWLHSSIVESRNAAIGQKRLALILSDDKADFVSTIC